MTSWREGWRLAGARGCPTTNPSWRVAAAIGSRTTNPSWRVGMMALLVSGLGGCAPILVATAGAVGGYAISRDSVTMDLDRPINTIWAAVLEETKKEGRVKRQDQASGRIDAQIREASVVVTLEQLTPSTVRVVVRARKYLLPQVDVAQRLAVAIARRVG